MPGELPLDRLWTSTIACGCIVAALVCNPARAEVTIADNGAFVIDRAELLDPATREKLEGWLRELEQKTTDQIKLLTVRTTEGEDISSFAQRHFDRWKLGQAGKDNGALLVLALQERKFRIHTSYGLEGALPDAWCGTAYRQLGQPRFKEGKFALGLYEIAIATANKAADEAGVKLTGLPALRVEQPVELPLGGLMVTVILVILVFWYLSRKGKFSTSGPRNRSGWPGTWGGPGTFGGGFGGFGGGRGGGFGGSFGGGGRSGGGGGGGGW